MSSSCMLVSSYSPEMQDACQAIIHKQEKITYWLLNEEPPLCIKLLAKTDQQKNELI